MPRKLPQYPRDSKVIARYTVSFYAPNDLTDESCEQLIKEAKVHMDDFIEQSDETFSEFYPTHRGFGVTYNE